MGMVEKDAGGQEGMVVGVCVCGMQNEWKNARR
jgi:hypothetical protein